MATNRFIMQEFWALNTFGFLSVLLQCFRYWLQKGLLFTTFSRRHVVCMKYFSSSQLEVNVLSLSQSCPCGLTWPTGCRAVRAWHSAYRVLEAFPAAALWELWPLTLRVSWTHQLLDKGLPWAELILPSWGLLDQPAPGWLTPCFQQDQPHMT